jgi:hypothetical protein
MTAIEALGDLFNRPWLGLEGGDAVGDALIVDGGARFGVANPSFPPGNGRSTGAGTKRMPPRMVTTRPKVTIATLQ